MADRELDDLVAADQIRHLFAKSVLPYLVPPIDSILYGSVVWKMIPHRRLWIWMSAMFAVMGLRLLIRRLYRRAQPGIQESRRWGHISMLVSTLNGLMWGVAIFWLYTPESFAVQLLYVFLCASLLAGATGLSVNHLRSYFAFTCAIGLPLAARFFMHPDWIHHIVAIVTLFYVIVMSTVAVTTHRTTREAARLRFRLAAANETLARRADELEQFAGRLRRTEERLRLALDAARLGVWYYDHPFDKFAISPGISRHFGLRDAAEVTVEAFYSFVHPEDRDRVRRQIERCIETGEDYDVEYRTMRPTDGRVRWVRSMGRCSRDATGKPHHFDGVVYDTTQSKEEEERLRRAEERVNLAMDAGNLAVWYSDAPFEKVVFSTGAYRHLGLPVGTEVTFERYYTFVHPDDRDRVRQVFERCIREGINEDLEFRTVRPTDGRVRWIRTMGRCFRDQDGKPHHFDGVTYDITRKKREEEERERLLKELSLAEERLQLVMESCRLGVFYCDSPFDKLVCSPGIQQHLGVAPNTELSLESFYSLIHPDDRTGVQRAFERCIEDGEDYEVEYRVVGRLDGRLRWLNTIGRGFHDQNGKLQHFDGITYDITQRKRQERERERLMKELSEATLLRERLLGIVGHDLKTPLGAVAMAAGLLRRHVVDEAATKNVDRILFSTDRMKRLISQLLEFARIRAAGGLPVEIVPVDLHALCRHVIDELAAAHPQNAISLEASGDGSGVWDGDRLAQVVSNLFGNAIQHGGGAPISVRVTDEGESVAITVHNEGPPIPADVLPFIFDPFQQAERSGKAHSQSIGLGLYIVQQIVLAHGGQIDVKSHDGEGTTFTIRLPRHPSIRGTGREAPPPGDATTLH